MPGHMTYLVLTVGCLIGVIFFARNAKNSFDGEKALWSIIAGISVIGTGFFFLAFMSGAPLPPSDGSSPNECGGGPFRYDC